MIERKFRVNLSEPVPKKLNEVALYESLIFALQRAFDYAPLSTAISLSMNRSIGSEITNSAESHS
ncbi:hypothetical protein BWD14_14195 [Leptospira santarosai]|uniref:Uncharacterized protein n=1 Tax=Leptospira santarosai TaxID=28183 RepID=A0AB73ND64_9LEPT|nr:hypothetical protein BWD14_14195 [Leptospira santarosai]